MTQLCFVKFVKMAQSKLVLNISPFLGGAFLFYSLFEMDLNRVLMNLSKVHIFTKGSSYSTPSLYYLVKNFKEIEAYYPSAFEKVFQISNIHNQEIVEQMIQLEMDILR